MTEPSWERISEKLRAPFDPADVDFRVHGRASDQTGKAQVVAYVDARAVQDRLDAVVGAGNWAFDWTPIVVDKGEVQVAKGTITIYGVSKSDAGSASNFEQSLGAVSHCFKRAAVHWGVGRYLYDLRARWVAVEKNGRIPDGVLANLRAQLPGGSGRVADIPVESDQQPPRQLRPAPGTTVGKTGKSVTWASLRLRARVLRITTEEEWRDFVVSTTGKTTDLNAQDFSAVQQKIERMERGEEPEETA